MNYPFLKLPTVIVRSLGQNGGQVYFYQDWQSLLCGGEDGNDFKQQYLEEMLPLLGLELAPFRKLYQIGSCQLLCAVYPEERIIRIGTPRLAREVFLLNEAKHLMDQMPSDDVKNFIEHVEQMAILEPPTFPSDLEILAARYQLPHLVSGHQKTIETEMQSIKQSLISEIKRYRPSVFERLTDWGLGLTANYALFRIHLLKFLAMLPSLDYDQAGIEVKKNLLESLRRLLADSEQARQLSKEGQFSAIPRYLEILVSLNHKLLLHQPAWTIAKVVRFCVRYLAKRFIAGESIDRANKSLRKLFHSGRDATLDQLGELVVSEAEADHYCAEVIKLVRGFKQHVPVGSKNKANIMRANVSIKVSALCSNFNPAAFDFTYQRIAPRLAQVFRAAKEEQVFINIDAEHIHYRDTVFQIFKKLLLTSSEFVDFADCGIVVQAYLQDSYPHFLQILELAKTRGIRMPVRLVKGAYWDAETVEAAAHHSASFQFLNKEETDLMFRQIAISMLENGQYLQLVAASHNYLDHSFVEAYRQKHFPQAPIIEHQCLDMTYEALSKAMARLGWAVRNYVPVGSLLVGMAYLVRRIMENSSQVGVLTIMRSHHHDDVVKAPEVIHQQKIRDQLLTRDLSSVKIDSDFHNIPPVRLYRDLEQKVVLQGIEDFKHQQLGKKVRTSLNLSGEKILVYSPSDSSLLVGSIASADISEVDRSIISAKAAYDSGEWAKARPAERASVLMRTASLMVASRVQLASLMMYEAGKILSEALGDVDEAIDFLNFYAREEIRLHRENPQVLSKGVIAVVAPWNFPLAIPCGMVAAPLVAGNAVVLKSASVTPLTSQKLVDLFHQAGVPEDILQHLPGSGATVGEAILTHPDIAGAVFTGSKEVGINLVKTCSTRLSHNDLFKISFPVTAIAEMGGKNAIVVTATADLDQAVSGIILSSFGHAGQKCSACSRVLVDERVADRLIERIVPAIKDLPVGASWDLSTLINPLISRKEAERVVKSVEAIKGHIEQAGHSDHSSAKLWLDLNNPITGSSVGPVVVEVSAENALSPDSFAMKELFAPVLHIVRFKSDEQALSIVNASEYALTAGVYSQSQDEIDWYCQRLEAGNIYINRTVTGARVAIEPFGGFKLSGTGPKAGGHDYLRRFHIDCNKSFEGMVLEGQRGSDYKFRCSLPSKTELSLRVSQVVSALKHIERVFETIFTGVYGSEKLQLRQLIHWIETHYQNFRKTKNYNHVVPGQESYNDYQQSIECSLLVSANKMPEFSNFLHFIFAILGGTGMTVLVRNEVSYKWWTRIASILFDAGIEKNQFDLYFCTEPLMHQALKVAHLSAIIIDGDQSFIRQTLPLVFDPDTKPLRMKTIYTHLDRPQEGDFERFAKASLLTRSMAVNTMRHGAPLEVE